MKLLLTNDDGIGADGLQALFAAAQLFGQPLMVAPLKPQSGCSHQVTTHQSLKLEFHGEGRYAVDGTPADCVRIGLSRLLPDPVWVLSGINHGGNLGADVYYSGTVAAVREAVLHGFPGIAFSHYRARDREFDWPRGRLAGLVLAELLQRDWRPGSFWNVNFPHLDPSRPYPPIIFCPLDPSPLPLSFQHQEDEFRYNGDYHNRLRVPGCDVAVCFEGAIAVSLIRLL